MKYSYPLVRGFENEQQMAYSDSDSRDVETANDPLHASDRGRVDYLADFSTVTWNTAIL